jgi:hypothetical protein
MSTYRCGDGEDGLQDMVGRGSNFMTVLSLSPLVLPKKEVTFLWVACIQTPTLYAVVGQASTLADDQVPEA